MTSETPDPWALLDPFERGYLSGMLDGLARGRELADAEAAAAHHQAWRVVQSMARLDTHEDRERKSRDRARAAAKANRANAEPLTEPDQPAPDIVRASLAAARTPGAAA